MNNLRTEQWRDADPRTYSERRSTARPVFIEGWRKPVGRSVTPASTTASLGSRNKIEIWVAGTEGLLRAKSCLQLLTDRDWESLVQIQDPRNRNSAISARVLLRLGLSRATDRMIGPADWEFSINAQQRPIVANGLPQIHFSVSHVDQVVVVAISPNLNIGIDVEGVDQDVSESVIADFCHRDEQRSVRGLHPPQKIREFIRLWTLKEAYTKMIGVGHSLAFNSIKFALDPINLAQHGDDRNGTQPHFENFYVSMDHELFHASLAIETSARDSGCAEVQIISLLESEGAGAAFVAPMCA